MTSGRQYAGPRGLSGKNGGVVHEVTDAASAKKNAADSARDAPLSSTNGCAPPTARVYLKLAAVIPQGHWPAHFGIERAVERFELHRHDVGDCDREWIEHAAGRGAGSDRSDARSQGLEEERFALAVSERIERDRNHKSIGKRTSLFERESAQSPAESPLRRRRSLDRRFPDRRLHLAPFQGRAPGRERVVKPPLAGRSSGKPCASRTQL